MKTTETSVNLPAREAYIKPTIKNTEFKAERGFAGSTGGGGGLKASFQGTNGTSQWSF